MAKHKLKLETVQMKWKIAAYLRDEMAEHPQKVSQQQPGPQTAVK